MKQCHTTREFILPKAVSKVKQVKASSLEFSQEENEVNLRRCQKKRFYDQKVCRHLCSNTLVLKSTRTHPITPCESICFGLTRTSDAAGEVCPFQKYCPKGCPCPYYQCGKLDSPQKLVPVFELKKSENTPMPIGSTSNSSLNSAAQSNEIAELIRSEFEEPKFNILLADFNGQIQPRKTNASDSLFSYERF